MTELPNWIDVNDIVRGPITRITDSGKRQIEFSDKNAYVNFGSTVAADIGDIVAGRILNSRSEGQDLQARCLTSHFISDKSFTPNDGKRWGTNKKEISEFVANLFARSGGPNNYAHFCMEIDSISNNGNPIANAPGFQRKVLLQENPDALTTGSLALVKIYRTELTSLPQAEFITMISQDEIQTFDLTDELCDFNPTSNTESENQLNSTPTEGATKNSSTETDRENLERLRKRAEQEGTESVSESSQTESQATTEYTRSEAVREYVKARADGICEGCNDSAPFIDESGDPFLHAHHIYELNNGGQDTVDTVVALCPNCHNRVHYGQDGDEFNEDLLTVVQSKEAE